MNVRSLSFKIALWSAVSLILLAATLTLYSVWTLKRQVEHEREMARSTSEQLLLDGAKVRAKEVEDSIMRALQSARVMAQTFSTMAGQETASAADRVAPTLFPEGDTADTLSGSEPVVAVAREPRPGRPSRREAVDHILQAVLNGNPDFLAVYTAWEPNAFDGRDANFVGARGTDASGRLIPYWSRSTNGTLGLEPLVDYETPGDGDYYLLPKKTGTEHVLNPYLYPVQGREILITSLVVPILADGRFQGIVGVDIALERLQEVIDETAKGLYDGVAGIALISHDGTIVAASGRPEMVGKPISAMHEDWQEDLKVIQDAEPAVEEDEGNLMAIAPVRFGEESSNWGIQLMLPLDWVMAQVEEAASEGRRAIGTMIGLSVVCLVLGVALMMLVAGMIVRPISQLSLAVRNISEGDGDLTRDLDDSGKDEIAELARAFNGFQGKLRKLISQLADGGQQVANSADQLSVMSDRSADIVKRQHSETDQVATAMNEMTATVAEVSSHASQAAEATQQADQQADAGRAAVSRSVEAMQTLSQQVQSASEAIARVSSNAAEITGILDVIGGIADQTNLLALNAAIEAARAGEHGRGFAVVADEVRSLAGRTQNSTREIQGMIERLQNGTQGAVQVMDAGQDRAKDSLNAVAEAADAIETMAKSVASVKDMNMQIASAAEEQTAVAEEIDRNLATIVQLVEQVSSDATDSNQAAQRLKQLSTEQNARLERFKV
ncbi:methyl-accepting chemotaxis protein [Rhabdochromatium marinum]|uniref:methyl-accepting chemotaxis protein n=1 Tax=Rhabdochromatium marinum TaxID=48729 RepID=UPI0019052A45|nr:methyl-accepting chemotaxis protein [Rhabdochromatium marinum]MBK1650340.1 chemotaxis protein [Rhabdochromatium marinum]